MMSAVSLADCQSRGCATYEAGAAQSGLCGFLCPSAGTVALTCGHQCVARRRGRLRDEIRTSLRKECPFQRWR